MSNQMQWMNALSTKPSLEKAIDEVVEKINDSFSITPDLGILFISSAFASDYPRLMPILILLAKVIFYDNFMNEPTLFGL